MVTSPSTAKPGWISNISFRRIITSNRFIPEIDGFRFVALFIVIFSHIMVQCGPPLGDGLVGRLYVRAFQVGGHGVYLFFTISGFILALPFARHHLLGTKPVALGSYFMRRITRLEPPYVIVMIVRSAILVAGYKAADSIAFLSTHLLASLFYLHGIIFQQSSPINPPAWSLEIEIQFYILAPFLTSIFLVKSQALRRFIIFAVILFSGIAASLLISPFSRANITLLNNFQYFAAGFLLCDLYLAKPKFSLPPLLWDAIGLAALTWILFSQSLFYPVILPFVTLCLYMSGFYGYIVKGFFSLPLISIIGGMCYSIYLTHTAVLTGVNYALNRMHIERFSDIAQNAIIFPFGLGAVLSIGSLFYLLIERPCMDPHWPQQLSSWFKRLGRPRALPEETPAVTHTS